MVLTGLNASSTISILLVTTIGLGVIFGVLRIVNMAHGEFLALGGFTSVIVADIGLPAWLALPAAFATVGLLGLAIEPILIRHLYGRTMESILATWGLGIVLRQVIELVFGPGHHDAPLPIGVSVPIGDVQYSLYRIVIVVIAIGAVLTLAWIKRGTDLGIRTTAVMSNPELAGALGINVRRVYRLTFAFGAALTGLGGALVAPLVGVFPSMGLGFVADSFLAILAGGVGSLAGLVAASAVLGATDSIVSLVADPVAGFIAFVVLAVVIMTLRDRRAWRPSSTSSQPQA